MRLLISSLILTSMFVCNITITAFAIITPDIKANESDSPITLGTSDTLSITVSLSTGNNTANCDWWVAESTPDGWNYYSLNTSWTSAGSSYTGLSPTHRGGLFDLNTYEVLNMSGLSAGTHTFYFAIDTNMNGILDFDQIFFDSVEVTISEDNTPIMLTSYLEGTLANAAVEVYKLTDLNNSIYSGTTDDDGNLEINISGMAYDELILISVSGGTDSVSANTGSINALTAFSEAKTDVFNVSMLTDLAWQYTRNLVGEVHADELKKRLDEVARVFIGEDINGDSKINRLDFPQISPLNASHLDKLNIDYQALSEVGDDGESIINAYRNNEEEALLEKLEGAFGLKITLSPAPDSSRKKVRVKVIAFGDGSYMSTEGNIDYDSDRESGENTTYDFFDRDNQNTITIVAIPKTDTEILSWDGCDTVSTDKTECQASLGTERDILVNFGYKEAIIVDNLVDLTDASVTTTGDKLSVTINAGDDALDNKVAALSSGDFVVGDEDGGFLWKVTQLQKDADKQYTITFEDATLDEVVKQGTGQFKQKMLNEDLLTDEADANSSSGAKAPYQAAFKGIEGVRLIPSEDPKSDIFTILIGTPKDESEGSGKASVNGEVVLYDNGVGKVTVSGSIDVSITLDTAVYYGKSKGLIYFRFIPKISAEENITLTASGVVKLADKKIKIYTLKFKKIKFTIGAVPVWITPVVDVFLGAEIEFEGSLTTSIDLKQELKGGVIYNKMKLPPNLIWLTEFTHSETYNKPELAAELSLTDYIEFNSYIKFYGKFTGPELPTRGYLSTKAELADELGNSAWEDNCNLTISSWVGVNSKLEWDLNKTTKIGKFFTDNEEVLPKASITLFDKKWLKAEWEGSVEEDGNIVECLPPFLQVEGTDFEATYLASEPPVLQQEYILTNNSEQEPLEWLIEYDDTSGVLDFDLDLESGTIGTDTTTTVTTSVDTSLLNGDDYTNTFKFINKSQDEEATDTEAGNREFNVRVTAESDKCMFNAIIPPYTDNIECVTCEEFLSYYPDWSSGCPGCSSAASCTGDY